MGAADAIARDGGFSLWHRRDEHWAIGLTPDGDEFLPLWVRADDVRDSLEAESDYEIKHMSADELRSSGILERIDADEAWVALALSARVH